MHRLVVRRRMLAVIALCTAAVAAPQVYAGDGAAPWPIRDGDVIVFYGDSITEQHAYTTYLEAYITTRFPQQTLVFRNAGWGGDRVSGGGGGSIDVRLERDVLAFKPSVVTCCLGMNDAGYRPLDEAGLGTYRAGLEHIIKRLKDGGVREVVIVTPGIVDPDRNPQLGVVHYNDALRKYGVAAVEVAKHAGSRWADIFAPFTAASQALKKTDAAATLIPDSVHPNEAGQLVMAFSILDAMSAPSDVAGLDLIVRDGQIQVRNAEFTKISEATAEASVSFMTMDDRLPMPIAAAARPALKLIPLQERLNRHVLQIEGLAAEMVFELFIDGERVTRTGQTAGMIHGRELIQGINLSEFDTPITKQADALQNLIFQKNQLRFQAWRAVQLFAVPDWLVGPEVEPRRKTAIDALMKQVADLEQQIRSTAQPRQHRFTLRPTKE